jgi:hypothetical protein
MDLSALVRETAGAVTMTREERNNANLKKVEDLIFDARHNAGQNRYGEIYEKLDAALLLVQRLGMGLKIEREGRNAPG